VRNDGEFVAVILQYLQKVTGTEDTFFLYGLDIRYLDVEMDEVKMDRTYSTDRRESNCI
jgi:hypothetical protein